MTPEDSNLQQHSYENLKSRKPRTNAKEESFSHHILYMHRAVNVQTRCSALFLTVNYASINSEKVTTSTRK